MNIFDVIGALIVGVSNVEAAEYIFDTLSLNPSQENEQSFIQGVLFFDTTPSVNEWMIRDVKGTRSRYSSSVNERDCFVLFDESRCRGSDVKMKQNAELMLTLGPGMCKDKLMQAAGRARLLGKGQNIHLIGMSDVTAKILEECANRDNSHVTSLQVLQWVMSNTKAATKDGMTEWAAQGGLFCITEGKGEEEFSLLREQLSVNDLYNFPVKPQMMDIVYRSNIEKLMVHRRNKELVEKMPKLLKDIDFRVSLYGSDFEVVKTVMGGECERELERAEEEEMEEERQCLNVAPRNEIDWDYKMVLNSKRVFEMLVTIGATRLSKVIEYYTASQLQDIPWTLKCNIYCTKISLKLFSEWK